ncbi:MAG: exodeoxyribonuclease VII large subunit [Sedimenticola sp.]|nr:MAG: exodeoxyribonuclease VII large subunit [Sedimenticola sp.]
MPNPPANPLEQRDIYSVSRLNGEVRAVLEGSFPLVWVQGEISNIAQPSSGHIYFSLKDSHAQVRCAMFRMKRQYLRFQPANGNQVLIRARISLYEGRGEFQLIVEHMEAAGEGALRQAFEELKRQLAEQGLFDTARKRVLPRFPKSIGIITSPSGAAIRDVLTVLKRRCPAIPVIVYPVPVQGETAAREIIDAIRLANRRNECDLLILTRGGGSLEDLMAFNDEQLARSISDSAIPVISAVGHEVDFTIADYVADHRAPTPSAAAELASPDTEELLTKTAQLERRMRMQAEQTLRRKRQTLEHLIRRLDQRHPGAQLQQKQQRTDELEQRLHRSLNTRLVHAQQQLDMHIARLFARTPGHTLNKLQSRIDSQQTKLRHAIQATITLRKQRLTLAAASLNALSPLATLERGYSITRHAERGIVRDAASLSPGDRIHTQLAKGSVTSRVIAPNADDDQPG